MRTIYNDDELIMLERRREEYTSSFFLSFFLSRVRISIGEKDFGGEAKSDEKLKRVRRRSVARMSLSLLVSFVATKRKGVDFVARSRASYRDTPASFPTRVFRTHNTCVLKYLIEQHFKQKRAKRWPRRRNTSRN